MIRICFFITQITVTPYTKTVSFLERPDLLQHPTESVLLFMYNIEFQTFVTVFSVLTLH